MILLKDKNLKNNILSCSIKIKGELFHINNFNVSNKYYKNNRYIIFF